MRSALADIKRGIFYVFPLNDPNKFLKRPPPEPESLLGIDGEGAHLISDAFINLL